MKALLPLILLLLNLGCQSRKIQLHEVQEMPYKLCFIGDTGNNSLAQTKVRDALLKEDCHKVYHLGDIIYPDGLKSPKDPLFHSHFFTPYEPLLKKSPMSLVLGNHDYQGNREAWITLAKEHPEIHFPSYFYLETTKNLCVFALDTNLFVYGKYFLEAMNEASWLKRKQKETRSECDFNFYLTHHPYFSHGKHQGTKGIMKEFMEQQILGKGDILLSGHDHFISDEGKFRGTRQLVSGAGGQVKEGSSPGFITVELWGNKNIFDSGVYKLKIIDEHGHLQTLKSGKLKD